jgi:hypothetical protein
LFRIDIFFEKEMNSVKDKFFKLFHSKVNLKRKLKNVVVDFFFEKKNKVPLLIVFKIGNEVKLKSGFEYL